MSEEREKSSDEPATDEEPEGTKEVAESALETHGASNATPESAEAGDAEEEEGGEAAEPNEEGAAAAEPGEDQQEPEPDQQEGAARERPPKRSQKSARGGEEKTRGRSTRSRVKVPQLPPESQTNSPKPQTLGMLGAVMLATLTMWIAAKAACNAHPVETRSPRNVTTKELAKDPKNAGLELQQRWATMDFKRALELAKGEVKAQLDKAQKSCDADVQRCIAEHKKLEAQVLTTATLLTRDSTTAKVEVVSHGLDGGPKTYVLELVPEGKTWMITKRTEGAAPKLGTPPSPSVAPPGSAAPPASAPPTGSANPAPPGSAGSH